MGIAAPPIFSSHSSSSSSNKSHHHPSLIQSIPSSITNKSMSQDFHHHHHTIFSFPTGQDDHDNHQHIAQQIRRDKLRIQGFEAPQEPPPPPLVGIEEEPPVYEATGMLSEMFNFPSGGGAAATGTELLDHHHHHHQQSTPTAMSMSFRAADSMQLFLMNPQTRSPSPPPSSTSTLHMLLPNPNPNLLPPPAPQFASFGAAPQTETIGGFVEGQGLSLSLSSSLQHLEAAKVEELRNMGTDHTMMFYNNQAAAAAAYKGNLGPTTHPVHVGYGSSLGVVNVLRNSKYLKVAQELLEEFCSVGRGQFKKSKLGGRSSNPNNSNTNPSSSGGNNNNNGSGSSSSASRETTPLSTADRMEHQRRKVKLLSMLDEVDRRYNHYCEQMQMVVNSFDLVMGFGAAVPYTALAQKAMSRHFRCLKDAIAAQLKHSCELLGEKDGAGTSGITKGETPRLKLLDQSLRQQRAFHQMGMMEQEAWRPQRGLPERSVNILRAWLFEHFLHPYPSDADKHLLARQTGLSRNQVSNWFINARVRLWKPMVEEMYQQEAKDEDEEEEEDNSNSNNDNQQEREIEITRNPNTNNANNSTNNNSNSCSSPTAHAQTPTPPAPSAKRSHINASESDPSFFSETQAPPSSSAALDAAQPAFNPQSLPPASLIDPNSHQRHQRMPAAPLDMSPATLIRFGAAAGDVSLTLGLRHAGNMPAEKGSFSVTDFGGC